MYEKNIDLKWTSASLELLSLIVDLEENGLKDEEKNQDNGILS